MSEFELPIYEAGAFWRQVKRGISGLGQHYIERPVRAESDK